MSQEQFANNATTTLSSAATSGATTMALATGTGALFPEITGGQYFTATLWAAGSSTGTPNEIVRVTAVSGDTVTVARGQEGTTAQAWAVGDTFANYPTAAFVNGLAGQLDIQAQAGNSAVDTGTANAGLVALSPVPATMAQLLYAPIRVEKIAAANTGNYTLNVNGLGIHNVLLNGAALAAGQLGASLPFEVTWDGTNFQLLSNPAQVTAAQIANNAVGTAQLASQAATNAKLALMAADTVKANLTGGSAAPADVTLAALMGALGFGTGNLTAAKGHITFPVLVGGSPVTFIFQWVTLAPFGPGSTSFTWDTPFNTIINALPGIGQGLGFSGSASAYLDSTIYTNSGGKAWTNNGASTPMGVTIWAIGY